MIVVVVVVVDDDVDVDVFWLPLLPSPPPVFSNLAFPVKGARICCISVFGLATNGGV